MILTQILAYIMKFSIIIILSFSFCSNAFSQDSTCTIFDKIEMQQLDSVNKIFQFQYAFEKYSHELHLSSGQMDSLKSALIIACPSFNSLNKLKTSFRSKPTLMTDKDYLDWLY